MPDLTDVLAAYEACAPVCGRPGDYHDFEADYESAHERICLALWQSHVREWLWRQSLSGFLRLEIVRGMYATTVWLETAYARISTTGDTEDAALQAAVKAIGGKK